MADDTRTTFEVLPGLFIGGLRSLGQVRALGVTHILSVINFEVKTKDLLGCQALHLPIKDDDRANLLELLPAALTFIDSALRPTAVAAAAAAAAAEAEDAAAATADAPARPAVARVLVHCQAGISRSCAVVAAYIMRSRGVGADEALALVKQACPAAHPNDGFVAQLHMFGDMRCSLNSEHPLYRTFFLQQVAHKYQEHGYVDPDTFAVLPTNKEELSKIGTHRCRKCRVLVATASHVVPVDEPGAHKAFIDYRTVKGHTVWDDVDSTSSLFLHPMAWMASAVGVGQVQGKLYCPGCNARLGSFNWAGITNAAGAWVTPAFQLHAAKLDSHAPPTATPGGVRGATGIRVPLFGRGPNASSYVGKPSIPASAASAAPAEVAPSATEPAAAAAAAAGLSTAPPAAASSSGTDGAGLGAGPSGQAAGAAAAPELTAPPASSSAPAAAAPWFTHLIFDCDGVMVDSERASCESLHQAMLQVTGLDIPHEFPVDYIPVFGRDVRGCVAYYKELYSRDDWTDVAAIAVEVQAAKEPIYMELTKGGIAAFGGVKELIAQAVRLGIPVGVGSSGAPHKIRHNLRSGGLIDLIPDHLVVSASEVAAGKPAPDVYIEALRRIGCTDPRRALVIEDAVLGLMAARGAGVVAVGVTNSLPRELLAPHADRVVDHLSELDLATYIPHPTFTPSA